MGTSLCLVTCDNPPINIIFIETVIGKGIGFFSLVKFVDIDLIYPIIIEANTSKPTEFFSNDIAIFFNRCTQFVKPDLLVKM